MSDAPEIPPWLRETISSAERASEAIRRSMALSVSQDAIANAARAIERYQVMRPSLERALKSIQMNQLAVGRVQELFRRYSPENWHDLQSGELDVVDLVEESGIPVVWVPRAEIIEALLAADSSDRYRILESSSGDVIEDLDAVLARARGAEVQGHADACNFADEAIAAARDGHWSAAQALAASGLGQVVHGIFRYPLFRGLGAAHRKFSERDVDEATMVVLKAALLEVCTAKALTDIHRAQPHVFNRHGTQHGDRRFFSQSSSLGGLLLLVGWVREFAWIAENRADILSGDGNGE